MIEKFAIELPHRISLSCRAAGPEDAPVLLFLHGFPEGAFVWDEMLAHFSSHYRCVAPNLRGYECSSAPFDVESYRARHVVADIAALIEQLGGRVEALVAHDWGGALAWNLAAQQPKKLKRLVIVNSPHPATFVRELQRNPAQQAASAYMTMLARPDAESLLEANDFAFLWRLLLGPRDALNRSRAGAAWLTDELAAQYRELWSQGLHGPVNYYRASPLRPPSGDDSSVIQLSLPRDAVTVSVPTRVVWAEADEALLPGLVDGLDDFIPELTLVRIPDASHWIVHEQPQRIAQEIEAALAVDVG